MFILYSVVIILSLVSTVLRWAVRVAINFRVFDVAEFATKRKFQHLLKLIKNLNILVGIDIQSFLYVSVVC